MKAAVFFTILVLILLSSGNGFIQAMGSAENSESYKTEIEQTFRQLIEGIYSGNTDAAEAKSELDRLRESRGISYNDNAGVLDSIIDRAYEHKLTYNESLFYFDLLQDNKLVQHRQESYRLRSQQHQKEIIKLMLQHMETAEKGGSKASGLRAIVNNYYDLVGLEYDSGYSSLIELVLSLEENRITSADLIGRLNSMNQQLSVQSANYSGGNGPSTAGTGASASTSGSSSGSGGAGSSAPPGSSQSPGNSGKPDSANASGNKS